MSQISGNFFSAFTVWFGTFAKFSVQKKIKCKFKRKSKSKSEKQQQQQQKTEKALIQLSKATKIAQRNSSNLN